MPYPLVPPVPIPAGQQLAWALPVQNIAVAIQPPAGNGTATVVGDIGEVTQGSSGPLGNPGFSVLWQGFVLTLPRGAKIQAIYPVLLVSARNPNTFVEVNYGNSSVGYLNLGPSLGLGGAGFTLNAPPGSPNATPFPTTQATTAASIGTTFDPLSQIGIQINQTSSGSGYPDYLSGRLPAFAVYFTAPVGQFNANGVGSIFSGGAVGGGNPTQSVLCLPEGKRILEVVIDFTSLPTYPTNSDQLTYPEFTSNSQFKENILAAVSNPVGAFQTIDINLGKRVNAQNGLSEVRAMIAKWMPFYAGNLTTPQVPAFVQANQGTVNSGNINVAFGSANAHGNCIVVAVAQWQGGFCSVTDSNGNVYTREVSNSGNWFVSYWVALNCLAGSNTVQVTNTSGNTCQVAIHEYSGVATTGAFTVQNNANAFVGGGVFTLGLPAITTRSLLFTSISTNANIGSTTAPGYTKRVSEVAQFPVMITADAVQPAGTYSVTWGTTLPNTSTTVMIMALSAAGAPPPQPGDSAWPCLHITNPGTLQTVRMAWGPQAAATYSSAKGYTLGVYPFYGGADAVARFLLPIGTNQLPFLYGKVFCHFLNFDPDGFRVTSNSLTDFYNALKIADASLFTS